jgi:hypothetical protein
MVVSTLCKIFQEMVEAWNLCIPYFIFTSDGEKKDKDWKKDKEPNTI